MVSRWSIGAETTVLEGDCFGLAIGRRGAIMQSMIQVNFVGLG